MEVADAVNADASGMLVDVLSERDQLILEFERQCWKYAGAKEHAMREKFDMSANRYYQAVHHEGDPGAPVKAPDMTWAQVRSTARRLLPGVRYRRRLLWRYSLLWTKP